MTKAAALASSTDLKTGDSPVFVSTEVCDVKFPKYRRHKKKGSSAKSVQVIRLRKIPKVMQQREFRYA